MNLLFDILLTKIYLKVFQLVINLMIELNYLIWFSSIFWSDVVDACL